MKKVISYVLLMITMIAIIPGNVLAETVYTTDADLGNTEIGVNIIGSASIDVVTTISADITLDLSTGETTPTYMEIQNNSSVPVDVKITDIYTLSEGAPNTFVANDKSWTSLSKEETRTYVNFNIFGSGQNVLHKIYYQIQKFSLVQLMVLMELEVMFLMVSE